MAVSSDFTVGSWPLTSHESSIMCCKGGLERICVRTPSISPLPHSTRYMLAMKSSQTSYSPLFLVLCVGKERRRTSPLGLDLKALSLQGECPVRKGWNDTPLPITLAPELARCGLGHSGVFGLSAVRFGRKLPELWQPAKAICSYHATVQQIHRFVAYSQA